MSIFSWPKVQKEGGSVTSRRNGRAQRGADGSLPLALHLIDEHTRILLHHREVDRGQRGWHPAGNLSCLK